MAALLTLLKRCVEDWLFPIRLRLGKRIMYDERRKIVQVSRTELWKGPCTTQELEAMLFVAENTSVCVPRVHRTYQGREGLFVAMAFVRGQRLDHIWPRLSDDQKEELVGRVWCSVQKLRAAPRPPLLGSITVGSASLGGSVRDGALSQEAVGPFSRLEDFNRLLRGALSVQEFDRFWREGCNDDNDEHKRSVFVHADLSPRNIIVTEDASLCILDWEFAGWWPAYWEYVKWHFADFPPLPGWVDTMDRYAEM